MVAGSSGWGGLMDFLDGRHETAGGGEAKAEAVWFARCYRTGSVVRIFAHNAGGVGAVRIGGNDKVRMILRPSCV